MRAILLLSALSLALAACGGRDYVAEGTPVYKDGQIVRWTGPGESFSANVQKGQPYVAGPNRVEIR